MFAVTNNQNHCHTERSTAANEASRRAQSKDPYPPIARGCRVKAFSLCFRRRSAIAENSLTSRRPAEVIGILRLRELIRARSAQDDSMSE